jgi:putative hydrolase of the HAD superfamily
MKARLRAIVASDHEASRARGLPWPEVDAVSVFARALGLGAKDAARACVAWECACNPASPLPGARAFLARCAAAGLPLGIVSNAQFYTPLFIEAAYGAPLFGPAGLGFDPDLAFWSFEQLRAKPDPHMFRLLAKELRGRGVDASEACYIGNDALNDCAAAAEAGFMTVLFAGDRPSFKPRLGEPGLRTPSADALADSWGRVEALVFGSAPGRLWTNE